MFVITSRERRPILLYSSAVDAVAVVYDFGFLARPFFLELAVIVLGALGAAVLLETRPDFVLVSTAGFSATAGAYITVH